jgi:hypothetical protein
MIQWLREQHWITGSLYRHLRGNQPLFPTPHLQRVEQQN